MKVVNGLLLLLCVFVLIRPSAAAEADFNCEQVIKSQLNSHIQTAAVFSNSEPLFVVSVCKASKNDVDLPALAQLYGRMLSAEKIQSSTPVVSLTNLDSLINPNINPDGKTRVTGILSVDPSDVDNYTVSLRIRFSSGQAIDIRKTTKLLAGQSFLFEHQGIYLGLARLPQKQETSGINSESAAMGAH
jgi:hypothetical protein